MKKFLYCLLFLIIQILILSGCSKEKLYDFVIGPQPTFTGDHQFVPGLNIFGVIRPDSLNQFYIEKVIKAVNSVGDSTIISNFNAVIYKINNNIILDSLSFNFNYPDTIFKNHPVNFEPHPGNHYKIICQSPGLPILTAETVFPNQPVIENSSINMNGNHIQFSILSDTTSFLYDIYLIMGNNQTNTRVLRAATGNTYVELNAGFQVNKGSILLIYTYDKNLSEYLTAANLFIKPNTYRPPFSTVQNGYGCFGSLNLLSKTL